LQTRPSYRWDSGETTRSIVVTAGDGGSRTHRVTVTSHPDVRQLTADFTVFVTGSHQRILYSDVMVSEWASFLDGKRVDRWINQDQHLPAGCSIISVSGQEYVRTSSGLRPNGSPVAVKDNGNNGFTISRPGGLLPSDLTVHVHVWHDGFSAIRVRAVYALMEADGVDCNVPGLTITSP
jgi:hypothetical protein